MKSDEVLPPWIQYPGYPPGDGFWRQTGQAWLVYIWEPFWNSLDVATKENYLKQWAIPEEWLLFSHFINPEFAEWLDRFLDSTDDD